MAVVVSFNGGPVLEKAVTSLLAAPAVERVIVVDNASTDHCVDALEIDERLSIVRLRENEGFGRGCNRGISLALRSGADFVFLLNQDAALKVGCVDSLLRVAVSYKTAGLLAPMQLSPNLGPDRHFLRYALDGVEGIARDLYRGELQSAYGTSVAPNAAAWLLSRRCLLTAGGFDPAFFMYGEDVDLFKRIRAHGFDAVLVPSAEVVHQRHQMAELDGAGANPLASRFALRKHGKALVTLKGPGSLGLRLGRLATDTAGDIANALLRRDWRRALGAIAAAARALLAIRTVSAHRRKCAEPGPHWLDVSRANESTP